MDHALDLILLGSAGLHSGGASLANISPITAGSTGIPSEGLTRLYIGRENPPSSSIPRPDSPVPSPTDGQPEPIIPVSHKIPLTPVITDPTAPDSLAVQAPVTIPVAPSGFEQPAPGAAMALDPSHLFDPGVRLQSSVEQATGSNCTGTPASTGDGGGDDSGAQTEAMDLSGRSPVALLVTPTTESEFILAHCIFF